MIISKYDNYLRSEAWREEVTRGQGCILREAEESRLEAWRPLDTIHGDLRTAN